MCVLQIKLDRNDLRSARCRPRQDTARFVLQSKPDQSCPGFQAGACDRQG